MSYKRGSSSGVIIISPLDVSFIHCTSTSQCDVNWHWMDTDDPSVTDILFILLEITGADPPIIK